MPYHIGQQRTKRTEEIQQRRTMMVGQFPETRITGKKKWFRENMSAWCFFPL